MTVNIRLTGSKEAMRAIAALGDEVREAASEAVRATAAELEGAVKLKIQQGPKTGRLYRGGNVVHQASAPGEAPANDTGTLMGSIYHEREADLTYTVGSRMVYAAYQEYGTSRMAARPFFRPAVEDIRPAFAARLEAIVAGAMR